MSEVRISAEPRTEFGKGGARRTRRAGKIPAVLYGHGEKPKHIALPAREFAAALRHGGANQLFQIELGDGANQLALAKALQRDPIKDTIDHVDLLLVRIGEKVTVEIPVLLVGELAKGSDGLIVQDINTLTVNAEATHLPDRVEVSIEGMDVGEHVAAKDVPLPEGSELVTDPGASVVTIVAAPSAAQLEADLSVAEAEAGIEKTAPEQPEAAAEADAEAERVEA